MKHCKETKGKKVTSTVMLWKRCRCARQLESGKSGSISAKNLRKSQRSKTKFTMISYNSPQGFLSTEFIKLTTSHSHSLFICANCIQPINYKLCIQPSSRQQTGQPSNPLLNTNPFPTHALCFTPRQAILGALAAVSSNDLGGFDIAQ